VRGGFEWNIASNVKLNSVFFVYDGHRDWLNSETYTYNPGTNLVDRDRFFIHHDQKFYGNNSRLTWDFRHIWNG